MKQFEYYKSHTKKKKINGVHFSKLATTLPGAVLRPLVIS